MARLGYKDGNEGGERVLSGEFYGCRMRKRRCYASIMEVGTDEEKSEYESVWGVRG